MLNVMHNFLFFTHRSLHTFKNSSSKSMADRIPFHFKKILKCDFYNNLHNSFIQKFNFSD